MLMGLKYHHLASYSLMLLGATGGQKKKRTEKCGSASSFINEKRETKISIKNIHLFHFPWKRLILMHETEGKKKKLVYSLDWNSKRRKIIKEIIMVFKLICMSDQCSCSPMKIKDKNIPFLEGCARGNKGLKVFRYFNSRVCVSKYSYSQRKI